MFVATGPGQVYSWDITKLPGPAKGLYYDAYVMIDIYSRYIDGAHVHAHESGVLTEELMREFFRIHGIPTVVHADRGTSMTSKSVATLLADLGVTRSHSRPNVSNDNAYSESLFKTMKYTPQFPDRFGSIGDAQSFLGISVEAYNHEHHPPGSACTPRRRPLRPHNRRQRPTISRTHRRRRGHQGQSRLSRTRPSGATRQRTDQG